MAEMAEMALEMRTKWQLNGTDDECAVRRRLNDDDEAEYRSFGMIERV